MDSKGPLTLVTIPVRDEARVLIESISRVHAALEAAHLNYVLSVAEDGSVDGTKSLLQALIARFPTLTVRQATVPLGRGKALRDFWSSFDADYYCFSDADLACSPEALIEAIHLAMGGCEIVTGSRYVSGAKVTRPPLRSFVSRVYNGLIRFAFNDGIQDHQCGLKVFSRSTILRLLPKTVEDSWFWDTEVLVSAFAMGIPVHELPVEWTEKKTRRTSVRRLLSDVRLHGVGLINLKSRLDSPKSRQAITIEQASMSIADSKTRQD